MKQPRVLLAFDCRYRYERDVFAGVAARAEGLGDLYIDIAVYNQPIEKTLATADYGGIIASESNEQAIRQLLATGLPCVNVVNHLAGHDKIPVVGNDDQAVCGMAATFFIDRGFERCAYFGSQHNPYFNPRRDFFRSAVLAGGASHAGSPPPGPRGESHRDTINRAAAWIATLPKPVGIFCPFDYDARLAVEACQFAGAKVPDEVSVIGVDNDPYLCQTVRPQLSSVATDATEIGKTALTTLLSLMAGGAPPPRPVLIPPTGVVERGSTGEMAIGDRDLAAALHYIRTNLAKPISITDVAESAAVSRRTLERKFVDLLGRSPLDEVRRMRLELAKRLLRQTDLSLKDIARRCGINYTQRLCNMFVRYVGMTPGRYRKGGS